MTMAPIIFAFLIVLALAVWVAMPLFGPRLRSQSARDSDVEALIDSKLQVYRAILDLEADHASGKVSDDDHRVMRHQLETEALRIMREVERLDPRETIDSLEREIATVRERLQRSDPS